MRGVVHQESIGAALGLGRCEREKCPGVFYEVVQIAIALVLGCLVGEQPGEFVGLVQRDCDAQIPVGELFGNNRLEQVARPEAAEFLGNSQRPEPGGVDLIGNLPGIRPVGGEIPVPLCRDGQDVAPRDLPSAANHLEFFGSQIWLQNRLRNSGRTKPIRVSWTSLRNCLSNVLK